MQLCRVLCVLLCLALPYGDSGLVFLMIGYYWTPIRSVYMIFGNHLQASAKRQGLGCVNSLPGSAWLYVHFLHFKYFSGCLS